MEIGDDFKQWIHEYYGDRADFILGGMYDYHSVYQSVLNKYKKLSKTKPTTYIWMTLSPDKLLRNLDNTPENVATLNEWCTKWFTTKSPYYNAYSWVIENGSKGDHLHVHAVCEMKTSHHHARHLKKFWAKYFPNNQLIKNDYYTKTFSDPIILNDKLEYMMNEKKGFHENLYPTGLGLSVGFNLPNL